MLGTYVNNLVKAKLTKHRKNIKRTNFVHMYFRWLFAFCLNFAHLVLCSMIIVCFVLFSSVCLLLSFRFFSFPFVFFCLFSSYFVSYSFLLLLLLSFALLWLFFCFRSNSESAPPSARYNFLIFEIVLHCQLYYTFLFWLSQAGHLDPWLIQSSANYRCTWFQNFPGIVHHMIKASASGGLLSTMQRRSC